LRFGCGEKGKQRKKEEGETLFLEHASGQLRRKKKKKNHKNSPGGDSTRSERRVSPTLSMGEADGGGVLSLSSLMKKKTCFSNSALGVGKEKNESWGDWGRSRVKRRKGRREKGSSIAWRSFKKDGPAH